MPPRGTGRYVAMSANDNIPAASGGDTGSSMAAPRMKMLAALSVCCRIASAVWNLRCPHFASQIIPLQNLAVRKSPVWEPPFLQAGTRRDARVRPLKPFGKVWLEIVWRFLQHKTPLIRS